MKIIVGDVLRCNATFVLHQVNCRGVMGSGVAMQVRMLFPNVYDEYKIICSTKQPKDLLGTIQFVDTSQRYGTNFLGIFNMFAQENYGYNKRYTDYDALRKCLNEVNEVCKNPNNWRIRINEPSKPIVAIPYLMGCCRGGGDWDVVSKIIDETLTNCDVYCYKF